MFTLREEAVPRKGFTDEDCQFTRSEYSYLYWSGWNKFPGFLNTVKLYYRSSFNQKILLIKRHIAADEQHGFCEMKSKQVTDKKWLHLHFYAFEIVTNVLSLLSLSWHIYCMSVKGTLPKAAFKCIQSLSVYWRALTSCHTQSGRAQRTCDLPSRMQFTNQAWWIITALILGMQHWVILYPG